MTVLALNHINLRAPRPMMERLRAFYVDVVGLEEGPRPPFQSFGYWLYAAGQPIVHLSEARPADTATANEAAGSATYDHVAFTCGDQPAVEARLEQLRIPYRVAHVAVTRQVQIFLQDPAGNGVELNFAGPGA
jgi:catechol 2,3-dioxygenase-like lactoylglutathione lyase family enzyme